MVAEWSIPADAIGRASGDYLYVLRATGEMPGGLMAGDRLLVDVSQVEPSPAGYFVRRNGHASFLPHIPLVLGKLGPKVATIGSAADIVAEYAVQIVGGIIGRWATV